MAATGQLGNVLAEKIVGWLLAKRRSSVQRDPVTGRFEMPYSAPYRWVMGILLAWATALLVFGVVAFLDDPRGLMMIGGIFGLFWLGAAAVVYEMSLVKIEFSEVGIWRRGALGSEKHLSWSSIQRLGYSENCKWFWFRTDDKKTIRVNICRDGLATLVETAAPQLEAGPAADGIPVLQRRLAHPLGP